MTETVKSAIFAGIALVMLVIGIFARPATDVAPPQADAGEPFWDEFDPQDIGRMRIVTFDADASKSDTFEVAKTPEGWVIQSHDRYPTDVKDKLADATAAIIDVVKGTVASDSKESHSLYGVVAPSEFTPGTTGVGTRITLEDNAGDKLADLIVGKEDPRGVEIDDPLRPNQGNNIRFVREFGQSRVYRANLDLSKLSTKFNDWIETDLLQLDAQRIKRVLIDSYSLQVIIDQRGQPGLRVNRLEKLLLNYDREASKWSLRQKLFDDEKQDFVEFPFDDVNDQLNEEKLNEMRRGLDDLQIVDVRRKPDVVSANLKVQGEVTQEVGQALFTAGFLAGPDGQFLCKQGEVIVSMEDGVEYVLRFGEVVEAREGKELKDEGKEDDDVKLKELTRNLMVAARFNKELIPPPKLQPLPPIADQPQPPPAGNGNGESPEAKDEAEPDKPEQADDAKQPKENGKEAPAKEDKPTEPELTPEQAARKKIEESNKRLQEEYDQLLKDGQEKANKLNRRFAEWYYIISDEESKKVRLRREEIVQPKEAKGQGNLPGDFEALKKGLKKAPPKIDLEP